MQLIQVTCNGVLQRAVCQYACRWMIVGQSMCRISFFLNHSYVSPVCCGLLTLGGLSLGHRTGWEKSMPMICWLQACKVCKACKRSTYPPHYPPSTHHPNGHFYARLLTQHNILVCQHGKRRGYRRLIVLSISSLLGPILTRENIRFLTRDTPSLAARKGSSFRTWADRIPQRSAGESWTRFQMATIWPVSKGHEHFYL